MGEVYGNEKKTRLDGRIGLRRGFRGASRMLLVHHVLASELYEALEALGAPRDLLGVIGSWGDGLDDVEVVALLQAWNRHREINFQKTPPLH